MKSPQALYRHNGPRFQNIDNLAVNWPAVLICQPDPGTADRTGVGLGMKTPVERITVFSRTLRTHRKTGHGRFGPVIGHILYYSETRSAIGAVYERIAVAPVTRIKDLPPAVVTYSDIRGYHYLMAFLLDTVQNLEIRIIPYRKLLYLAALD